MVETETASVRFERWAYDFRRAGGFETSGPNVYAGCAGGPEQDRDIEFQIEVRDGRIERARYRYRGGPWTGAACAYYADWLEGRPARIEALPPGRTVADLMGYPRVRYDEALQVEDAVIQALECFTRDVTGAGSMAGGERR